MITILNKRIPRYGREIRRFVKWLNQKCAPTVDVAVNVIKDQTIDDDGETYGLYETKYREITLAVGGVDCTLALAHLAHEYYHAIQDSKEISLRENDADSWAMKIMLDYEGGF